MKNFFVLIFITIFIGLPSNAEETLKDKWDSENHIYTNYTCCFYWILNGEFDWVQQPLMQKDAIFGAVDLDTRIVAYITATKMESNISSDNSCWEQEYESEYYRGLEDTSKKLGNVKVVEEKRVYLANKKALKTKMTYYVHGDDQNGGKDMQLSTTVYHVLHQGYGISFSIMVLKEIEDELAKLGLTIESTMFAGITFVMPDSLK